MALASNIVIMMFAQFLEDKMEKKFIRVTIQFDLDKDLTCDDQTLDEEHHGSLKELIEWFIEHEGIWQIIDWAEDTPVLKDVEEISIEAG